jgi:hypothetical protein
LNKGIQGSYQGCPILIWLIARQHPGEPQAEWYAEGLIEHLANNTSLLDHYTFHIVPNMNPEIHLKSILDGVIFHIRRMFNP